MSPDFRSRKISTIFKYKLHTISSKTKDNNLKEVLTAHLRKKHHVSKNESHRNIYPDSLFDNTFTGEKANACTPLLYTITHADIRQSQKQTCMQASSLFHKQFISYIAHAKLCIVKVSYEGVYSSQRMKISTYKNKKSKIKHF